MKRTQLYKKAIDKFGEIAQIHMVLEEMSELSKELLKDLRQGIKNEYNVASEVADVEITIEQIKGIYGIEMAVRSIKRAKKKRLQKLLEAPDYLIVKQVIERCQKRFKKQVIGDDIALVILDHNQEEVYFKDCNQVEVQDEYDVFDSVFEAEVVSYEIKKDYYEDETNKTALIINLKEK